MNDQPPHTSHPASAEKLGKKRRILRLFKRASQAALLLLIALIVFLGASHQGRASVKSAMAIPQMFDLPVKPLEWFTPEPLVERVEFPVGLGDVYRPPGKGPFGAAVLFLGVFPDGGDDPRIARLGQALARSNMATLIYWTPNMANGELSPQDIHHLVTAYQFMYDQEYVDPSRVGIGGFCVGASFSIMAASQDPINEQVSFVSAFGPYFHLPDLLTAIATGTRAYDGVTQPWDTDKLTREVYVTHLTEHLPENERQSLRAKFNDRKELPAGATEDFSDPGKAVYGLLSGVSRDEIHDYIARMPSETLAQTLSISPSQYIDNLKAPLLIMHDREDKLIPSFESRRLKDALVERGDVRYTEFGLFKHVTPEIRLGPWDTARELGKLFLHLHGILMQST